MRMRLLALLLLLLTGSSLEAADEPVELPLDRAVVGSLPLDGRMVRHYRLEVPPTARRLELLLEGTGDVDLYARYGSPLGKNPDYGATASSATESRTERIVFGEGTGRLLDVGTWYVDVVHGTGVKGEPLDYTLWALVHLDIDVLGRPTVGGPEPEPDEVLATFEDDYEARIDLSATTANYRSFKMVVAEDVTTVELSLRDGNADADLYIRHGEPMSSWKDADYRATGRSPNETIYLTREEAPVLRTGTWYVDVTRAADEDVSVVFEARYVRGSEMPEVARWPDPTELQEVEGEIRRNTRFRLDMGREGPAWRTYVVHVPKRTSSLLVSAMGASADVDLYLRYGVPIDDYGSDPDHKANGARSDEQLYVDRSSAPPLKAGTYYLDVARASSGDDVGSMEVRVEFNAERPPPLPATGGPVTALRFGQRTGVDLEALGRKAARFSLDVPAGAERMYVRVLGATRDVDLFLRHGEPITDYDEPSGFDLKAVTPRLNETVELRADGDPPLLPGLWFLDAASLVGTDRQIRFTIVASLDEPPVLEGDDFLLPPYERSVPLTPLEQALSAVVHVEVRGGSGSGTCVSPDGWILTNHHVVAAGGELQREDVLISFIRSFDEPPEQVFLAEVVEDDETLDLALLHVVRDIYDRPLPADARLPHLRLGDSNTLHHGDRVTVAGFPEVGGFESRTSVSITRGVVSGFITDARGRRRWIKTDARINAGNSGGAALDERLEYVGVPSQEQVVADDELGYIRPTSVVPAAWRKRLERRPR